MPLAKCNKTKIHTNVHLNNPVALKSSYYSLNNIKLVLKSVLAMFVSILYYDTVIIYIVCGTEELCR